MGTRNGASELAQPWDPRGLPPVPLGILACRDVAPPVWDAGSAGGSLICFPGEVAVPGDVEFVFFGWNCVSGAIVTTRFNVPTARGL